MVIYYLFAGFMGVTNMVMWGIYGDLLVEEFQLSKVLRSVTLGTIYSLFLFFINPNLPLFVIALIVIAFERTTTEIYKALIRHESQLKYDIPSDLNIKAPISLKRIVGFSVLILLLLAFALIDLQVNKVILLLVMCLLPALGGAAKDAPYEGFSPLKFLRTPSVSLVVGALLLLVFPSLGPKYFLVAVPGFERIISEFYKKIYRSKIPGKFKQTLSKDSIWFKQRKKLLFAYALNVLVLLSLLLYSLP
jgi:hypothetical protein